MKHALLVLLLRRLQAKPGGVFVLDTHAGRGAYDLMGEAERTGEWRSGIARLIPPPPALADYVGLVERLGLYPGSPALIRALLRPVDALACCELHPEDAAALRRHFRADPQVAVHHRCGYEAVRGLLPPAQKRSLVLIDPPYEREDEADRAIAALAEAARRAPNAVIALWYPIKHRTPVLALHRAAAASGLADLLAAELTLRPPTDPARLNGCGLLLRNPPFGFEAAAAPILASLQAALAGEGGGHGLRRLADEAGA